MLLYDLSSFLCVIEFNIGFSFYFLLRSYWEEIRKLWVKGLDDYGNFSLNGLKKLEENL